MRTVPVVARLERSGTGYSRHPAQIVVDSSFPHLYYSLDLHVLSRLWRMATGHPTASARRKGVLSGKDGYPVEA
jgi:hypothetical protein